MSVSGSAEASVVPASTSAGTGSSNGRCTVPVMMAGAVEVLALQGQVIAQGVVDVGEIARSELAERPEETTDVDRTDLLCVCLRWDAKTVEFVGRSATCIAPRIERFEVHGTTVTAPLLNLAAADNEASFATRTTGRALLASDPRIGSRSAKNTSPRFINGTRDPHRRDGPPRGST